MSKIIIDCGDILNENTLITLFSIYLEKTHNDIIKPKILSKLNKKIDNSNNLLLVKPISITINKKVNRYIKKFSSSFSIFNIRFIRNSI